MRIRSISFQRGGIAVVVLVVALAAWGLQLGAAPAALAQQTCPAGQRYCPSGTYSGQCRTNTVTCPTGSVAATVEGCSSCSCPSGQVVCSGACQVARQCPDANRATANQCAATNAASCGSCADGYGLNTATGLCEEVVTVVVTPTTSQVGNSDRSAVNVVQGGAGLLLNLQAQTGGDATTRKNVLTVDKTGVQVGWHPDPAKLGLDLSAAGGQNLIYGIARAVGMDPALDALLLLQTIGQDGSITDRIKVTRDGHLTASGNVRGAKLCIGDDCRASWATVAPASVLLQDTTPGTAQSGNFNLSGTGRVDSLVVAGGITAGGNVGIIGANGKIPAINSTYFTSLTGTLLTTLNASNLALGTVPAARLPTTVILEGESGASLTSLNASNLASGTVPSARLPSGLLQNPIDGGASNMGPWLTIQGGANIVEDVALRLYDAGTANGNTSTLEFAHNTGTGPGTLAFIKSVNVGTNASGGAALKLITASNNTGTFNTDQLVLRPDGNVRVSYDLSLGGGDILIDPGEHLNIRAPNGDAHLGGLSRVRAGGLAISDNPAATVPTRGIYVQGNLDVDGSTDLANGLTVTGAATVNGDLTANNGYECVNVGTELRCTLRQQWRVADKQNGFAMSWVGSDSCTNVCARVGLKTCSDIQFNYECPNGNLLNANWNDDDPNEFGIGGRSCSSIEPYRATVTGVTCPGQSGTEYKRYRCRCQG
ncbi:hypothetical protein HY634_02730 [Candidatus Uhrbacteria bacterium]|nr:hypothetical protein [Candidatus Uhrbacteria bacterium]